MFHKWVFVLAAVLVVVGVSVALAAETEGKAVDEAKLRYFSITAIVTSIGLALAAAAGAFSQSRGIRSALEGIARNPGASGTITTAMIIGLALIESLVIYVLVVSLILLFADPFSLL
ncbi:MAG: F0F1 ATP synthase subunit C [Nitrospinota bacterium]|nr:MAG: F0F1 ATP synthase subunit C [Nitrospinota bacterium]